jgi:hypothetical protein
MIRDNVKIRLLFLKKTTEDTEKRTHREHREKKIRLLPHSQPQKTISHRDTESTKHHHNPKIYFVVSKSYSLLTVTLDNSYG